jgi:hypothetical protein
MGSMHAMEFAGMENREFAIRLHLQSNHYPPVPSSMVEPCIKAIDIANSGQSWDTMIDLPEPIKWRNLPQAPASALIEAHHLDAWLEGEEI